MTVAFIFPGQLDTPTGGYRYDAQIIEALSAAGQEVELVSLEGNYPFPTEEEKRSAIQRVNSLGNCNLAVVDGLAGGAAPELMQQLATVMPVAALVHHPLCLEAGLSENQAKSLRACEAAGIQHAMAVITTSPATSKTVQELFGLKSKIIHCVEPGVQPGKTATRYETGPLKLLCVGSVIERKGHETLMRALSSLSELDWKLDCVGMTNLDPAHFKKISRMTKEAGLGDRILFHGTVGEKTLEDFYSAAHLFVLPSLYEGYGMAYAEAIVRGLPVIGTTAGAIPQTVPSECGILIEPDNHEQLAGVLETMITKPQCLEEYRIACLEARPRFPDWQTQGWKFAKILERLM